MQFDPNNPVVKLCAEGMGLEAEGKTGEAHMIFQKAWEIAGNDFEAFTAAHYLARNQEKPEDNLRWNIIALEKANAVKDETVRTHFPSLHLNIGKSYENMGKAREASEHYRLAALYCSHLPAGPYTDMIRSGISAGLERTVSDPFNPAALTQLVHAWCNTRNLKALSFILPAYVGNLGQEIDKQKLASALSYLSATRCLNSTEQEEVDKLIAGLTSGSL